MHFSDIAAIRLQAQQISGTRLKGAAETVSWMGALQAQDFNMSKWAIGARLPGITERGVEVALENGSILRTHLLRPTWHLVSAGDIRWMLALTGPRIKAGMASRNRQLGLTPEIFSHSNKTIEKALAKDGHQTREELVAQLHKAGIATDNNRASHLLMHAELEGLICSGKAKGKAQTYALLDERVAETKTLHQEEALASLAQTYFTSRGPATIYDFSWWSA